MNEGSYNAAFLFYVILLDTSSWIPPHPFLDGVASCLQISDFSKSDIFGSDKISSFFCSNVMSNQVASISEKNWYMMALFRSLYYISSVKDA